MYGCIVDNNPCVNKDTCIRCTIPDSAKLWKVVCNESNNYLLYVKKEEEENND